MDHVQIIADALDVEIFAYTPDASTITQIGNNPPVVAHWGVQVRGNRQPPSRQIHIINYQNYAHWQLLRVTDVDENAPDQINNTDWHLGLGELSRRPTVMAAGFPDGLPMLPDGHPRYGDPDLVPRDIGHVVDARNTASNRGDALEKGDKGKSGEPGDNGEGKAEDASKGEGEPAAATKQDNNGANNSPDRPGDDDNSPTSITDAEVVLSSQETLRVYHGTTAGNPGLSFTQHANSDTVLGLYRAFGSLYYPEDSRGWVRVLERVLRLWNAVTNSERGDCLARRHRRALYNDMLTAHPGLEAEIAGTRQGMSSSSVFRAMKEEEKR